MGRLRLIFHGAIFLVVLTATITFAAQDSDPPSPSSPTIASLQRSISQGTHDAESQFWARVQSMGSPLVEPLDGTKGNILVTFLWKGDSETQNVVLVNTAIASSDFSKSQLSRIEGTNVWYRTYPARAD